MNKGGRRPSLQETLLTNRILAQGFRPHHSFFASGFILEIVLKYSYIFPRKRTEKRARNHYFNYLMKESIKHNQLIRRNHFKRDQFKKTSPSTGIMSMSMMHHTGLISLEEHSCPSKNTQLKSKSTMVIDFEFRVQWLNLYVTSKCSIDVLRLWSVGTLRSLPQLLLTRALIILRVTPVSL